MKIQVEKIFTEEREIPVPSFWKESTSYAPTFIGILDAETAVRFSLHEKMTIITHADPDFMKSDIKKAFNDFLICDEGEFLDAYNGALESIRLKPELAVTDHHA